MRIPLFIFVEFTLFVIHKLEQFYYIHKLQMKTKWRKEKQFSKLSAKEFFKWNLERDLFIDARTTKNKTE